MIKTIRRTKQLINRIEVVSYMEIFFSFRMQYTYNSLENKPNCSSSIDKSIERMLHTHCTTIYAYIYLFFKQRPY